MATKKQNFKAWALSHSLHDPNTKLPLRLSIKVHEDIADFIHGSLIGLLLGLLVGLFLAKTLRLF